ncbi:hypothetical protein KUV89_04340 [Marinobacter hydrocarbonoclasticus]|nr:hypothetical protein [Marinobacter nauticus]
MKKRIAGLAGAMLLAGCQSGVPGSFSAHSYATPTQWENSEALGSVSGASCQRYWIYLLPAGEPPSTQTAFERALGSKAGAEFLANMSVESRLDVRLGYMDECILVEGEARRGK